MLSLVSVPFTSAARAVAKITLTSERLIAAPILLRNPPRVHSSLQHYYCVLICTLLFAASPINFRFHTMSQATLRLFDESHQRGTYGFALSGCQPVVLERHGKNSQVSSVKCRV